MLDADRVVRLLGCLGEVRRALVGDELHPRAIGGGFGDRAGDELAALTLLAGGRRLDEQPPIELKRERALA